jgi:1,4-dihydroxy-2-naphthoate octaprenyltransferase
VKSTENKLQIWLLAIRPKTLPAAAAPVIVGSAVAIMESQFKLATGLAALAGALLLQIGANLANDVFDFHRGADNESRLGPTRVTQAGLLTPGQVLTGMWIVFGLAIAFGIYLVSIAGWAVIAIGIFSILVALAYTGGPYPLGYYGLGDVAVFIFFGPVAVCGTYYVQAGTVSTAAVWASIPMGLLTVAILVVNNLRDIATDRIVRKKTLAVRLGEQGAQWEYALCLLGAYLIPLVMGLIGVSSFWVLLSWLSVPTAIKLMRTMITVKGRALNKTLAGTGQLELLYGVLFGLGLVLTHLLY